MPIHGFPGGVISSTAVTPSVSSASGVWTLDEQLQAGANWPVAPALLTNSVRLRASASAYMSRTPTTATNRKTWTWSGWVKRGALGVGFLFSANSTSPFFDFFFNSGDQLRAFNYNGSGYDFDLTTNAVFRDPAAWYHIVLAVDTTQATNTNRVKLYVNNVQQTFTGSSYPNQNVNTAMNSAVVHNIGREAQTAGNYFDGYITDLNLIDGQALTPNYFGATDGATGVWEPATYRGTYGTNGFYLPMNITQNIFSMDYLIVAGGGGGADYVGGGGGAGGLLTGSSTVIQGTTYAVTVGAGGLYVNGSNSTAFSLTSIGGGAGGTGGNGSSPAPTSGGSGGGGGSTSATSNTGGAGTAGQGFAGGTGNAAGGNYPAAGGGGASAVGQSRTSNGDSTGGNGGAGTASSITGSSVTYAGGGGGAIVTGTVGSGGAGGGGAGGKFGVSNGVAGTINTGGGSGGGGGNGFTAFAGGSGVVIMRILTSEYSGVTTGSPTVTTDGSYTVVKFTSSGSYTA
jgi:hypothetical protein